MDDRKEEIEVDNTMKKIKERNYMITLKLSEVRYLIDVLNNYSGIVNTVRCDKLISKSSNHDIKNIEVKILMIIGKILDGRLK